MEANRAVRSYPIGVLFLVCLATVPLYALASRPTGLWPLGWIALAPLIASVSRARPLSAALLGLATGTAVAAAVAPWLPRLVGDYFVLARPWSDVAAVAAWVASGGIQFALFATWLAWA